MSVTQFRISCQCKITGIHSTLVIQSKQTKHNKTMCTFRVFKILRWLGKACRLHYNICCNIQIFLIPCYSLPPIVSMVSFLWRHTSEKLYSCICNITGDPLHSRAACTQPCNVNTHSRAHCSPGARLCEQWGHGCVNNGARLCASARLCRRSPVNMTQITEDSHHTDINKLYLTIYWIFPWNFLAVVQHPSYHISCY